MFKAVDFIKLSLIQRYENKSKVHFRSVGKIVFTYKGKAPVILFHGITSPYS